MIIGVVTDQSGAVVSGASVEARNQASGLVRTVSTDSSGEYRFLNVDAGQYTVTVTTPGFAPIKDDNVSVLSRETARSDFRLSVKGVAQDVVVVASQSVVNEGLTESTSISGADISSLPLNFRATNAPSPIETAALTPGVNQDPGGNLTFAGQLPTATSFSLDGISIQSVRIGGPSKDLFPSVEGIAEFRVNTAGNSAEFAQPTDLTVVTRAGTNTVHGAGFWYFTRQDWNSIDTVGKFNPTLSADTFGTSVGGPLVKNKLHFYFDYEGVRLDQNSLIATQTLPAAWAKGDFSAVAGGATPFVLKNPRTGATYNNAALPVDPTSAKVASLFYPAPVGPNAGSNNIDITGNNLNSNFPGTYSSNGFDGRLDHNISATQHIFGRVTQHNITSAGTDGTALGALGAVGDSNYNSLLGPFSTITDGTNVAISHNWIVKPNLVNELRGGFTRYNLGYSYPQAAQGDSIIGQLGIKGLPGSPANGLGGVPAFNVGGLLGGATNPYGHPRNQKNGIWEVGNNLSWIKGAFNSKFGVDFRRVNYQDNITFETGDEYGDYYISGGQVCGSSVLNAYPQACAAAQLMLGFLDEGDQAQNGPDGKPHGWHWNLFGQTEWKVRPNVTATFGLRYELNSPFVDETNQLGQFDYRKGSPTYGKLIYDDGEKLSAAWVAAVGGINNFVLNSKVGLPPALRYIDKTNFQPRVGLSWSPAPDTVVRGAAGMYSVPVLGAVLYSLLGVDTSNFGSFFPTAGAGSMTWSNVFGGGAAGPPPCPTSCPGYRRANQWDLKDPRVFQWSTAFERNIGFKSVAKISYVGSYAWDLIYSPDLNQIPANTLGYWQYRAANGANFPNFREVLTRANGPEGKYNAISFEFNRRFGQGLQFNNAYTVAWNKTNALGAVPNSAIGVGGQGDNGANVLNAFNLGGIMGNAFYDPRHKFLSTFVYDLPFGRGKKFGDSISRAADMVAGGWTVSGITLLHSGNWLTPYFPSSLSDPSGTAPSSRSVSSQPADCVSGQNGTISNPTIDKFFDVKDFSVPSTNSGRFGNCSVGSLQGPHTVTFSMSAAKTVHVGEKFSVRYEAQFANLFNVNNWALPNTNVSSSNFGRISSLQDGTPGSQAGPRSIQMVLRLQF
jgi:hypothetical protein